MITHDNTAIPHGSCNTPSQQYQIAGPPLPFNDMTECFYAAIQFTTHFRSCFTRTYKHKWLLFSNLHVINFVVAVVLFLNCVKGSS